MARIFHGQLNENEMEEVTLGEPGESLGTLEVMNVDGSAPIYFRVDGVEPTVEGDDCEIVPAAVGAALAVDAGDTNTVKLISEGYPKYCIRGV